MRLLSSPCVKTRDAVELSQIRWFAGISYLQQTLPVYYYHCHWRQHFQTQAVNHDETPHPWWDTSPVSATGHCFFQRQRVTPSWCLLPSAPTSSGPSQEQKVFVSSVGFHSTSDEELSALMTARLHWTETCAAEWDVSSVISTLCCPSPNPASECWAARAFALL